MSVSIEALEAAVLNLPQADRSRLLDRLIESLEKDVVVENAWMVEARRRDEEIESGVVQAIPGDVALAALRAKLR